MKILFINHSSSRTGAPLILLYFMDWLKNNHPEVKFDVLNLGNGPLASEIDKLCGKHFKIYKKKPLLMRAFRFILRKLNLIKLMNSTIYDYEIKNVAKEDYDIIYNNTVVFIEVAILIKNYNSNGKLILHVHELKNAIAHYVPHISDLKQNINSTIAASDTVKQCLIDNFRFDRKKIRTIHAFTKIDEISDTSLKIDSKKAKIGGAGLVQKRKGVDLFIKACAIMKKESPSLDLKFQWLGFISEDNKKQYKELLKSLDVDKDFEFLGEQNNSNQFFKDIDVFWMTSREDPFPLVCIEAANNNVPILLFDKATGTQEIIDDLEHLIVPELAPHILARKTIDLIENQELYIETAKTLKERFSKFTIDNQSKKIWRAIKEVSEDL